jgi:hypothetical protein
MPPSSQLFPRAVCQSQLWRNRFLGDGLTSHVLDVPLGAFLGLGRREVHVVISRVGGEGLEG